MCRVFMLHRSGFYAWLSNPVSVRAQEDQRLLKQIKTFYIASGGTYGSPWIHRDMKGGKTGSIASNVLERNFNPGKPNQAWVSDITYVRTHEGFLYVATVLDLFSRRVVGWSMDKNIDRHLVIQALMTAVWKRQPKERVLVHSDQGSQYGSSDYLAFLKENNLQPSMSRRGNCHDNAVAESFFATFKKRVTKKKIYATRDQAKSEIFNFIEMFYNPIKRHSHTGGISPAQYEKDYFSRLGSV